MKLLTSCPAVMFALGSLVVSVACAAAYNPAVVSADARWVVYADLDGLRNSTLGKELVTAISQAQTATTGGVIGLDIAKVLTTVGSLTAYGTNLSKDPSAIDGALIAQGTADLRKIVESVLLQGTLAQPEVFSEVSDVPFTTYSVVESKAPESKRMQVFVAFPPEPIVLVSKSKAQLVKARDVFRGAAASLAKGGAPELKQLDVKTAGAYLFAASAVPSEPLFPQNAPQARILQLARSGAVALGENGPDLFARAELIASSDQNAEKLMKILQGMTSMLSLTESNDQQLGEFLNSTSVTREKETVTLSIAYPSARLAQMAQNFRVQVEGRTVNRAPTITNGRSVAEWTADEAGQPEGEGADAVWRRTIDTVRLVNGSTITLGRWLNGGKNARFVRVEVVPAEGSGAPLVFGSEMMRNARGTRAEIQFPGTEGVYTLKVSYVNDPDGKAKFAVSIRNPNDPVAPTAANQGPLIPQPKRK
jgi:hypothetical protein